MKIILNKPYYVNLGLEHINLYNDRLQKYDIKFEIIQNQKDGNNGYFIMNKYVRGVLASKQYNSIDVLVSYAKATFETIIDLEK